MSAPTNSEENSIVLKLGEEHKKKLAQAAIVRCMTASEYLLQLALDAATEEIIVPEPTVLSDKDWEIFTSSMENPPEPNEALKAAIKEHQKESGKW